MTDLTTFCDYVKNLNETGLDRGKSIACENETNNFIQESSRRYLGQKVIHKCFIML